MSCILTGVFFLLSFQGHVLDVANSVNPIITQTRNPTNTPNQQWTLSNTGKGGFVLVSALSGANGAEVVTWNTNSNNGDATFLQPVIGPNTSGQFSPHWVLTGTNLALTAWAAESGSTIAPVTFETFTNRPEQIWGIQGA
ncbi:hypothetical protein R3P38DRAFT_3485049 [Favolaschia claudopus]|uniref:Ricin B lectin domain-containing protein n=1 Tax=Favolaschia claudopus TaxID=2862362 RepID=A0AAW0CCH3_9AGAR